jgi:hypothetical protein
MSDGSPPPIITDLACSNASIFSVTIRNISSGVLLPSTINRRRSSITLVASTINVIVENHMNIA